MWNGKRINNDNNKVVSHLVAGYPFNNLSWNFQTNLLPAGDSSTHQVNLETLLLRIKRKKL